jgi:hypothetical protein
MYEVQNRSIDEHEQFSFGVDRDNLKWLDQANTEYISEMLKERHMENMIAHGALKGSIFKMKTLSADRLKGLGCFGFAALTYANLAMLTLSLGPTLPMVGIVSAAVMGARALSEQGTITKIDYLTEGEYKGQLRMTVSKSLFVSYTIVMDPKDCRSVIALGEDDMGADDVDENLLEVANYINETDGTAQSGVFKLPADAFRDKTTMEWVMARKGNFEIADNHFSM